MLKISSIIVNAKFEFSIHTMKPWWIDMVKTNMISVSSSFVLVDRILPLRVFMLERDKEKRLYRLILLLILSILPRFCHIIRKNFTQLFSHIIAKSPKFSGKNKIRLMLIRTEMDHLAAPVLKEKGVLKAHRNLLNNRRKNGCALSNWEILMKV